MLAIQAGTLKTLCKCESDAAVDSDLTPAEQPTVTVKCFDRVSKNSTRIFYQHKTDLFDFILPTIKPLAQNQQQPFSVKLKIPESIEIIEAVTENASSYRSNGKLIVTDGRNLVFFPPERTSSQNISSGH
jgi:hypothetical protein